MQGRKVYWHCALYKAVLNNDKVKVICADNDAELSARECDRNLFFVEN